MRSPPECYQVEQDLRQHMPQLTEAQTRGLAEWTYGTIAARSGCLTAAAIALAAIGGTVAAARQRLRERLLDGADRARPSSNQIDVRACFVPLTRWVLSMWKSDSLALAIDPTTLSDKLTAVVVSVVYRGCAVPVARLRRPSRTGRHAGQQEGRGDRPRGRVAETSVGGDSPAHDGNRNG